MITIIHGSDITKSRDYYLSLRQNTKDKTTLYGEKLTEIYLLQALSGQDLFDSEKEIFIEELFSKRKASKELDSLVETLATTKASVVMWESKDLTPKQLSLFKNARVQQFKIPTIVFTFVDCVKLGNGAKLLMLFHQLLEHEDASFALAMLQRQVRLLLALSSSSDQQISEVSRLAPWQMGKLKKQTELFGQEALIAAHKKLYEIEIGQKTGTLSFSLEQAIDFFLLSL